MSSWLRDMSIKGKVWVLIGVGLLGLGVTSATGYRFLSQSNRNLEGMYQDQLLPIRWLMDTKANAALVKGLVSEIIIADSDAERDQLV